MKRIIFSLFFTCAFILACAKTSPELCQGSLRPYPKVNEQMAAPDSLTPVYLIHIGRHGSRFPAGPYSANKMLKALNKADSLKTLTPLGHQFKRLIENIIVRSVGRWGALDSLGMSEQRGIALRTVRRCLPLFENAKIASIASHSPRAIMSMYSFTHEVSKQVPGISSYTFTGTEFNELVRPFDTDSAYKAYMKDKPYMGIYNRFVANNAPNTVSRLLGKNFPATKEQLQELSIIEYYNIANMEAMGMENDWKPYFSEQEYEKLWSCFNLRQYFMHCANSLSKAPANQAKPLLNDIISKLLAYKQHKAEQNITAYFAHQETVMPFMSLVKIKGTSFNGENWENLKDEVQDHYLCPMAANIQYTVYESKTGNLYLRCDLNEQATTIKNDGRQYIKLDEAIAFFKSLVR